MCHSLGASHGKRGALARVFGAALGIAALSLGLTFGTSRQDHSELRVRPGSAVKLIVAPAVFKSLAAQQEISVIPARASERANISAVTATRVCQRLLRFRDGGVIARELVELTGPPTLGKRTLVWALQLSHPNSKSAPGAVRPAPSPGHTTHRAIKTKYNYEVAFVNARSGKFIFATYGHASGRT